MRLGPFNAQLTGAVRLGLFAAQLTGAARFGISIVTTPENNAGWEEAVQQGIYAALIGSPELVGKISEIYDDVPERGATFPYVSIGDASHVPLDSDTRTGVIADVTIHTWSSYRGRREAKAIQGAIYTTLNRAELSFPGYDFITCDFLSSDTTVEPDGKTRHGVQVFQIILREV